MRITSGIAFVSLTILASSVGCELAARVDRGMIPVETGGSGGTGGNSVQSSSSSSSGQAGEGGAGGAAGSGGMAGSGGGMPCTVDGDCPMTSSVCVLPHCNNGTCDTMPVAAGTICAEGTGTK
ncbi:MAG TPA: hypothetical protein PK156_26845, partial [Polyangium sp.]|nr:hypothetical protein [Polyangium sp.]